MLYPVGTHFDFSTTKSEPEPPRPAGFYVPGTRIFFVNFLHELTVLNVNTRNLLSAGT